MKASAGHLANLSSSGRSGGKRRSGGKTIDTRHAGQTARWALAPSGAAAFGQTDRGLRAVVAESGASAFDARLPSRGVPPDSTDALFGRLRFGPAFPLQDRSDT